MERPFEPLGMCTKRWRQIEPVPVDIDLLIPSQSHLVYDGLGEDYSHSGDPFVHIVCYNGQMLISDGHHRVNSAKKNGQKKIFARVLIKIGENVFQLSKVA